MTKLNKTQLDVLISGLAGDLKPLVETIEKKLATTQNHYGDYMGLLSKVAGNDNRMQRIVVAALLEAGANHSGVASAYKIVKG